MSSRYARRRYQPQAETLTALEARKPFTTGIRLALGWELGQLAVRLLAAAFAVATIAGTIYAVNRYGSIIFGN